MPEVAPSYQGGSGSPLVLLHGFTSSWRTWEPVIGALERDHAVFAPTLAGHHGGSILEAGTGSVGDIADAVETALDDAGIETAHIVGNSLGGWISLELASRGRARSAVLFSPAGAWASYRDFKAVGRKFRAVRKALLIGGDRIIPQMRRPGFRALALRDVMVHGERVPAATAAGFIEDAMETSGFDDFIAWAGELDTAPTWPAFGFPVRVCWPEHDRILPYKRFGEPYREVLPKAEFVKLSGVGHVPMFDDPELVTRTILEVTDPVDAKEAVHG